MTGRAAAYKHEDVFSGPAMAAEQVPRVLFPPHHAKNRACQGPRIWPLMEAQPNLRTSRDDDSQVAAFSGATKS
jgi:hypothetical protein